MKERKIKRKAIPSNPAAVAEPGEEAAQSDVKLLREGFEALRNENQNIREQFKQLVGMLDKKFSEQNHTDQEKLTQIRTQQMPTAEQPDPRSEGMLNKKIGDTTVGEALSSLASIARAWQSQSAMDRDQSGVQNLNEFMANIGRTVFEKFVTKEGLDVKAGQQAVEENTAGIS